MAFHITAGPYDFRRNLGSQASSTSTPSETSTSAAAASTTTSANSGIFTANSSPPLIVAFLAIGLFMAATIAVFGWRRMYLSRGMAIAHHGRVTPGGRGDRFGEKPKLWDLWTRDPVSSNEEMKWNGIMVRYILGCCRRRISL